MKLVRSRIATTHVDRHKERMAREALEGMARDLRDCYIPVMWNHDIRHPPLGRVISGEVVRLDDGEYALETTAQYWEEGDSPERVAGDGRVLRLRTDRDYAKFLVRYDRSFREPAPWVLVQGLSELAGAKPEEEGKKALEPVSTLVIAAGAFALGSIVGGFLSRLGSDLYEALKERLSAFFDRNPLNDTVVDIELIVEAEGRRFEAHVLFDNPSPQQVRECFDRRFGHLDHIVRAVCQKVPDVGRIVLEWREDGLSLRYVVTEDCVPMLPTDSSVPEGSTDSE